jgi:predicted MPP superfamily phosphohydrolase
MRKRIIRFVVFVQAFLFLVHLFLYETWTFSPEGSAVGSVFAARLAFGLLSICFVTASLLGFRYNNPAVRVLYSLSATWIGFLTFFFGGAVASWLIFTLGWFAGFSWNFHRIVEILFTIAAVTGISGLFNARWTRITRTTVRLPDLPATWRGRRAALVSDLHLGHVRNGSFLRRIIAKILKERPDAVFIAGDLFDGMAIHLPEAAEPLKQLAAAPYGAFFVAGNHEQFGDDSKYLKAVAVTGVRVLSNEKVDIDGLQIIGVPYLHATEPRHFSSVLHAIGVDRHRASILLTHAPDHPEVAAEAGVSLQLSGHTHSGQFFPWIWVARRVYKQFAYGLSRIGEMFVITSSGAGTWGPPLRLGTNPEIVLIEFL